MVFFINVDSNVAPKISHSNKNFDLYFPHISAIFLENSITEEEFKKAYFSLKLYETAGYDNINVNVIKKDTKN